MLTVMPIQFAVGMKIRLLGDPTNEWVTIKKLDKTVPNLDDNYSSLIVFQTDRGVGAHRYNSKAVYELHPNSAHLR